LSQQPARSGAPFDGLTLAQQLEQTSKLLQDPGRKPKQAIVDLGYRGVDADNPGVEIIHRGKYKTLTALQRRWLKRRQAIEPMIGHTKSNHRMGRCWLKGAIGDALHAISCAVGYNIRWLMRAIAAKGLAALPLLFSQVALYAACIGNVLRIALRAIGQGDQRLASQRHQVVPLVAAGWGVNFAGPTT